VSDWGVEKVRVGMEAKGAIPKAEMREGRDGKLRNAVQQKAKPEAAPAKPPAGQRLISDVEEAPAPRPVNWIAAKLEGESDEGDALESHLGYPEV